jgi:hypothetical protein
VHSGPLQGPSSQSHTLRLAGALSSTHPVEAAVRIPIAALADDAELRSDVPTASGMALREIF